jgi:hypothetical protein
MAELGSPVIRGTRQGRRLEETGIREEGGVVEGLRNLLVLRTGRGLSGGGESVRSGGEGIGVGEGSWLEKREGV